MRRVSLLLLLAFLVPGEATESSDALGLFLDACRKTWAEPPVSADVEVTVQSCMGETAATEGTFDGPFRILPSHGYLSVRSSDYVEKAARVRDGWAFHRILSEQRGEKRADREEMDCWRKGKALVRAKGKGYELTNREA